MNLELPKQKTPEDEKTKIYENPSNDPLIAKIERQITEITNQRVQEADAAGRIQKTGSLDTYPDIWRKENMAVVMQQYGTFVTLHPEKAKAYRDKIKPIGMILELRERMEKARLEEAKKETTPEEKPERPFDDTDEDIAKEFESELDSDAIDPEDEDTPFDSSPTEPPPLPPPIPKSEPEPEGPEPPPLSEEYLEEERKKKLEAERLEKINTELKELLARAQKILGGDLTEATTLYDDMRKFLGENMFDLSTKNLEKLTDMLENLTYQGIKAMHKKVRKLTKREQFPEALALLGKAIQITKDNKDIDKLDEKRFVELSDQQETLAERIEDGVLKARNKKKKA
jgi:hypothetical protein